MLKDPLRNMADQLWKDIGKYLVANVSTATANSTSAVGISIVKELPGVVAKESCLVWNSRYIETTIFGCEDSQYQKWREREEVGRVPLPRSGAPVRTSARP